MLKQKLPWQGFDQRWYLINKQLGLISSGTEQAPEHLEKKIPLILFDFSLLLAMLSYAKHTVE